MFSEMGRVNLMEEKKRISVALDAELHKQLKIAAAENNTTIGDIVSVAIKMKLDDMKVEEKR